MKVLDKVKVLDKMTEISMLSSSLIKWKK
jgi:hypothetical protein